jgi:hypothetical protein
MGAEEPLGPLRFESRQGRTIHPEGFDVGAQLFGNASQQVTRNHGEQAFPSV